MTHQPTRAFGSFPSLAWLRHNLHGMTLGTFLPGCALAALLTAASTAQACPFGPRPTEAAATYIAVCAGTGPGEDKFITTRTNAGHVFDNAYLVSAAADVVPSNGIGFVKTSARVSQTADGLINPDLHASVSSQLARSGSRITGDGDGAANAAFRDIITIRSLGAGPHPDPDFFLHFDLDGILISTGIDSDASFGAARVTLNFGLAELGNEANNHVGGSLMFDTELGFDGPVHGSLAVGFEVEVGKSYVLSGDIDVRGFGRADGPDPAVFAADFGNSAEFRGLHFYTDATQTAEYNDLFLESAFGFDYRLAGGTVSDVPEPGSMMLLGTAFGLVGLGVRRRVRLQR